MTVTNLIIKTDADHTHEVWSCSQGSKSVLSQQNHLTSSRRKLCTTVPMPISCSLLERIHNDDLVVSSYLPTTHYLINVCKVWILLIRQILESSSIQLIRRNWSPFSPDLILLLILPLEGVSEENEKQ